MAKACDCSYFIGKPGGVRACPFYDGVGFLAEPKTFMMDDINACLVGTSNDGVILAFRGTLPLSFATIQDFTQSCLDWLNDGNILQVPLDGVVGRVHRGFANTLLGLWPLFLGELKNQLAGGRPLLVTGHSKGGTVAILAAARLVGLEAVPAPEVFTFAAARPGNPAFADAYQARIDAGTIKASWRFEFQDDIVPHLPPKLKVQEMLAELDSRFAQLNLPGYESAGTLQFINWNGDIVGDGGFLMEIERLLHLSRLVLQERIQGIERQHSLETSYIPALTR
jgi:hypothetical protein